MLAFVNCATSSLVWKLSNKCVLRFSSMFGFRSKVKRPLLLRLAIAIHYSGLARHWESMRRQDARGTLVEEMDHRCYEEDCPPWPSCTPVCQTWLAHPYKKKNANYIAQIRSNIPKWNSSLFANYQVPFTYQKSLFCISKKNLILKAIPDQ